MVRILAICSIFLFLFLPGGKKVENFENVAGSFDSAVKMQVTIENKQTTLSKGDDKFEKILKALKNITEYAHDMPAFGVSLDDLTREERKTGTWLELEFNQTHIINEMPFDALLIKVEKDNTGFNLIRRNNGKYVGRCFYLSLDKSMSELYYTINSISTT